MKKTFKVSGMHCKSCEVLIADVLGDITGVKQASASEKASKVEVDFDEKKVNEQQIKSEISKLGYKVS